MQKFDLGFDYRNFHFVGIGGVNMSALAEVLFLAGYSVSGSDKADSPLVAHLRGLGINVSIGHDAANLPDSAEVVVYNAAVPAKNPEMAAARARGLKFLERPALLGLLMRNYSSAICVAGTHGKTTTTSMLAEIFMAAEADPTVMNGGVLPAMGGTMRIGGNRKYFIAEACEYHDSFLQFHPFIGIILNIEMDHSDYFGNEAGLRASFRKFAELIPPDGLLIINHEIHEIHEIVDGLDCQVLTYGEERLGFSLNVPGEHNISNAKAAILAARFCGLDEGKIAHALQGFTGALRRFERKGRFNDAEIIDDYAHHPTEVSATLQAAKSLNPARIWAIFQPHTPGRTAEFLDEFAESLRIADEVLILDIYKPAGREEDESPIHAKDLAAKIPQSRYIPSFEAAAKHLAEHLAPGDMAITMGAGDVHKVAEMLLE
ncbi:MAG: UDP-N-acetylmuramate--L-alanine ligase [Clostridiales bacterium]|jgi:UDP-N-acetylmuramate--alanine ligase|nr:UDP-N-acetylmuramate--L-alanine ligase [Clostridiales bacterium]